jgi:SAM-dependent methyltransferase
MVAMTRESTESLYRTAAAGVRPSFGTDRERALHYYARLIEFVCRVHPTSGVLERPRLLDVGCGSGWSTFAFALTGYDAFGIDLNLRGFEPPSTEHCRLQEASALDIPFRDGAFDVVASYQFIEHAPSPERALDEIVRVCRPGGVVCIIGPNLVSPLLPLLYLAKPSSWRDMSYFRRPGLASHPYGNTLWEIIGYTALRTFQMLGKLFRRRPTFTMRVPDTRPPFHSDNDACYLCNPTDLIAFFKSRGFRVVRKGRHGRPPLSYLLAGGTWVAARKPA